MWVTSPANSPELLVRHRPVAGRPGAELHLHAEGQCPFRGCPRDPPEPGETERASRNIVAEEQVRFPSGEPPGANERVGLHGAAGSGHDQQHRDVGGGVGEHTGCVADEYRVRGGRPDVDVVEPDRVVGDSADLRDGQEVGVERVAKLGHHHVVVAGHADLPQPGGVRKLVGGDIDAARGAQQRESGFGGSEW